MKDYQQRVVRWKKSSRC